MSIDLDYISRQRIVRETDKSFFVEAGAGSGKTTMLINRMVAMVEQGCDISKICAITFTRAAANEFYERFQQKLIERSSPDYEWKDTGNPGQLPKPTDLTRVRCRTALENIDLCFMGTIDAFCIMVLSEHPAEAGVLSDAGIVSEEDAMGLYRQVYVDIAKGLHGEELRKLSREFHRLYWNHVQVFEQGIRLFMGSRNVHFNFEERMNFGLSKAASSDREILLTALKCLLDHPELKYTGKNQSNDAAWEALPGKYNILRNNWYRNIPGVIRALKDLKPLRLALGADAMFAVSLSDAFVLGGKKGGWLEFNYDRFAGLIENLTQQRYELTLTFLSKCVPVLEEAMREKGWMTYFDCLYYLRNMFRKDAEQGGKLIRYIYERHSYVLIDEFQDTNPLQAEVFFYLTAENPVPQWRDCIPRPGSLFIVGDPKQSIYRFRSADVSSFLTVKRLFEKNAGDILTLSRNFRSTRVLCEYFNEIFAKLLPEETDDQSRFEPIPLPDARKGEFEGVYKYKAYMKESEAHPYEETDAAQIAKIIRSLVNREEYRITSENETAPRPIRYGDFMVITSAKADLVPIMACLREQEIPMHVEGSVEFGDNQALREIAALYKAAISPDDELAAYGALTGKLSGLTDRDYVSGENPREFVMADVQNLTSAALFSKLMDSWRVYNSVEAENLEVFYYSLELLRNAERGGTVVTLRDGADFLTNLIQGTSGEERCLSFENSRDCVHLANLHKIKGLEAPIVILSGKSARKQFGSSLRVEHGAESSEGYIFSIDSPKEGSNFTYSYCKTEEFSDEKDSEETAQRAENDRLIYVAATRARNALIISESIQKNKKKEIVNSRWAQLLDESVPYIFSAVEPVDHAVIDEPEEADSESLYEQAEESSALRDRSMEAPSYAIENPSKVRGKSKLQDDPEEEGISAENAVAEEPGEQEDDSPVSAAASASRVPAALLGTMIHRLMEMLVSSHNRIGAEEAAAEIVREYITSESEDYKNSLIKMLTDVAQKMRSGGYPQDNSLPANILSVLLAADEVSCEVPFCYREESAGGVTVWNGIMDVVYRTGDTWHILDYKTNADGSDLDDKYQEQMQAYEKAFEEITGEKAEARTYHIGV